MVTPASVGWGSYGAYEGTFYRGKCPYVLPGNPTEDEKVMAVITATEGGKYDAFNGYDGCGWTSGVIQWIEKNQYSVSDMLGLVFSKDAELVRSVLDLAKGCGYSFGLCGGKYRFCASPTVGVNVVDSYGEQQILFYRNSTGKKGSWQAEDKNWARMWAAAISTVWENSTAQSLQLKYTAARLNAFMLKDAATLFSRMPQTQAAKGLRAGYLSFAANNPTRANKALKEGLSASKHPEWSNDWVVDILRALTFNPQVAIYPHRYDKIRPVLEQLYALSLPDFSKELQVWVAQTKIPAGLDTRTLQRSLISLGYDLGPAADDGVYGRKTTEAVMALEQTSGLVPAPYRDGVVDSYTYVALCSALEAAGLPLIST